MTINDSAPPAAPKKWTILVWAASDNDLYPYEVNDLDKFERVGCGPDLNLLATVDHRPNADTVGPHGMQRLELQRDDAPGLNSPVKCEAADGNMACPKALADFVKWGVRNYPAENYWLVISDHGDAWHGACEDEGHAAWMSLPQIQQALSEARVETGRKLDMVSFDCCYMASAEVAHELKDEARYLVASEEEMGYKGLDYESLLPQVAGLAPREAAQALVAVSAQDPTDIQTFSAIDLERIPAVTQAFQALGQAIVASPKSGAELRQAVQGAEAFWEYRDAYDLADRLAESDLTLQPAAAALKASVEQAVIAERHADNHPRAHGLLVEVNPDTGQVGTYQGHQAGTLRPMAASQERYRDTGFARDTGWAQAINKMSERGRP